MYGKMETFLTQRLHVLDILKPLQSVTLILAILQSPTLCFKTELGCELQLINSDSPVGHSRDGDIIIAGILQILLGNGPSKEDFTEVPLSDCCFGPSFQYLKHLMAFIYAIEEINNRSDILPNITLGFQIYDACTSENLAVKSTLKIVSETPELAPNYICQRSHKTVAVIGHLLSSATYCIARLTQLYGYPQISYGAPESVSNDRIFSPSLYHNVPSEFCLFHGIIQLLGHFGWTWVGIITSDDDSNQRTGMELKREMGTYGICVDFTSSISLDPHANQQSSFKTFQIVKSSRAKIIILYCSAVLFVGFLESRSPGLTGRVWISTMGTDSIIDDHFPNSVYKFNGSLIITAHKGEIPGFQTFLYQSTWKNMPDNAFVDTFWRFGLGYFDAYGKINISPQASANDTLWKNLVLHEGKNNYCISYSIYNSVYLISKALHQLQLAKLFYEPSSAVLTNKLRFKLNHYLKKIPLKTSSGGNSLFQKSGYIAENVDILNWVATSYKKIKTILVGTLSSSDSQRLLINDCAVIWHPNFDETPRSLCSDPCVPGYRKSFQTGKLSCCFDCVQCSSGEITNGTVMENCEKCPDDQWSNPSRDKCINRKLHFLAYEDNIGRTIVAVATIFSVMATSVLWVFVKHRNTPLVRANNYKLSYTLLVSLIICFLLSFLFIGHPNVVTCLMRQTTFALMFAVAISTVLGKTITVIIAFNATKPGSRLQKYVGSNMSIWVVLLCSLGELVICATWLTCAPPFVDLDTKMIPGEMIVQCNEGSVVAFYSAIIYIGVLAIFSFIIAFVSRKLPHTFNEAQHITFSMLVFCSVWMSFIPTYLSTNGKYMVAVEVFAILASNGALLGFIFIPKCYIILLKPERNRKGGITVKVTLWS